MSLLYNLGIGTYGMAARLAALSSEKVHDMLEGQKQTFARLAEFRRTLAPGGFDLWVHASSLGEFEQGRPLIEAFLAANPDAAVLLSFFSPSGYRVRHNFHPRVAVVYLPFDTPDNARRFVDEAAPAMAVFVKYEFWGNYLHELRTRRIPTYIISAIFHPGQIFFRPWGGEFRDILRCFTHLYVQDEASRKLLAGIGIGNVTVAGDTRFDRVAAIGKTKEIIPLFESFRHRASFMLVAGSSWPADEEIYFPWLKAHPQVCAVIAPHEFDKTRVEALRQRLGAGSAMAFSELLEKKTVPEGLKYIILDTFGMLSKVYSIADVAYVGGGFGAGIHNINEPAAWGVPVVYGPRHRKFNEATALKRAGGGFSVDGRSTLEDVLTTLLTDGDRRRSAAEAARRFIAENIGATERIMADITSRNNTN